MNLTTKRLTMRPFTLGDDAFVLALLNDPDWLRYIGDRGIRTLDDARRQITDKYLASYARDGVGLMAVTLRDQPAPIGMCGLIKREGLADVDIGFAFLPAYRAQGYALEAADAVLVYGRDTLKITRVVAITLPENVASIRLLERIGLRFESHVKLPHDDATLALYAVTFPG